MRTKDTEDTNLRSMTSGSLEWKITVEFYPVIDSGTTSTPPRNLSVVLILRRTSVAQIGNCSVFPYNSVYRDLHIRVIPQARLSMLCKS